MINPYEARILAWKAIADKFGHDFFKSHFEGACEAYPSDEYVDSVEYEYFLGFEGDDSSGLWTVFARIVVNRETKEVVFLDYRMPDGHRMENPSKPIRFT